MKYRCKIELAAEVLSASLRADKKTHIMNNGKLNSKQLSCYLKMLLNSGLLSFDPDSGSYFITEEGRTFLRRYKSFKHYRLEAEKKLLIVKEKRTVLEQMCSPLVVSNGVQDLVE